MIQKSRSTKRVNSCTKTRNDFASVVKRHPRQNRGSRGRLELDTAYVAVITKDARQDAVRTLTFKIYVDEEQDGIEHKENYPLKGQRRFLLDKVLDVFGVAANESLEGEIGMVRFCHNKKDGKIYKNFCIDESITLNEAYDYFRMASDDDDGEEDAVDDDAEDDDDYDDDDYDDDDEDYDDDDLYNDDDE